MNRDVTVRRFGPDEWRTYRDLRLRALADAPDSFSRTLAEERSRPDAEWAARLTAVADRDVPLLAEAHGEAVGLAWGRIDGSSPDEAHLYQMWVAPGHRGKGVGRLLLDAIVGWARAAGVRRILLGVTSGDTPAVRLYLRAGFRPVGDPEPLRTGSTLRAQPMRLDLEA